MPRPAAAGLAERGGGSPPYCLVDKGVIMTTMDDFFMDFTGLGAHAKLRALAASPLNLRAPGVMSPERIAACRAGGGGFELLFFGQRLDDEVLSALQELADESRAVEQFAAMRRGAVCNRIAGFASEERQVLHCSCRDIFRQSPAEPESTSQARAELEKLRHFLADLEAGRLTNPQGEPFTGMIQVGIGGSDLGPRALYLALQAFARPGRRVEFISNVDPDGGDVGEFEVSDRQRITVEDLTVDVDTGCHVVNGEIGQFEVDFDSSIDEDSSPIAVTFDSDAAHLEFEVTAVDILNVDTLTIACE